MVEQEFQKQKENQFKRRDHSSIGEVDERIKKLVEKINANENYYTTSSCSGRNVLIRGLEKKGPGLFLWMSHNQTSFEELKEELKKICKENKTEMINFKFEPCLIVVAVESIEKAEELYEKGKEFGFKKSGLISAKKRFIVEMLSTEKLELPIIENGKILVDDEFLKILMREANKKMEKSWGKIQKFEGYF